MFYTAVMNIVHHIIKQKNISFIFFLQNQNKKKLITFDFVVKYDLNISIQPKDILTR